MRPWWLRLLPIARPYWRGLLGIAALVGAAVAMNVLRPWPVKLAVDYVLLDAPLPDGLGWLTAVPGGGSAVGLLAWLAVAVVVVFVAAELFRMTREYVESGLGTRMSYDLGAAMFAKLQRLSLIFHGRRGIGDLIRRVTVDATCTRELLVKVAVPLATSLTTLIAMFVVMWQMHRWLSLVAIAAAAPIGLAIRGFAGPMSRRTLAQQEAEGELMADTERQLTHIESVQLYRREAEAHRGFVARSGEVIRAAVRAVTAQVSFKAGVGLATAAGSAAILLLGGIEALHGRLSLGSLLVFLAYLRALYAPLESLAYLAEGYAAAKAKATRALALLDEEEHIRQAPHASPMRVPEGGGVDVTFESVEFAYEPGRPVLKGVSLSVPAGSVLGLVGPTGSGKSTLAAMVPRLFDPAEGRVLLAGQDIRGLTLASVRSAVAVVPQDPLLLPLSLADNIAYGRPDADRAAIERAAEAAGLAAWAATLPDGLDTVVGERGATLSGGQRQRVAIARALLKDARVIVLDEPTAALDAETESRVMEAMTRSLAGRTVILIAHRLTTVRLADAIAVLAAGRVIEHGPPDEMLEAGGAFATLWRTQTGGAAQPEPADRP